MKKIKISKWNKYAGPGRNRVQLSPMRRKQSEPSTPTIVFLFFIFAPGLRCLASGLNAIRKWELSSLLLSRSECYSHLSSVNNNKHIKFSRIVSYRIVSDWIKLKGYITEETNGLLFLAASSWFTPYGLTLEINTCCSPTSWLGFVAQFNLRCHHHESLLHVGGVLGWCLDELNA